MQHPQFNDQMQIAVENDLLGMSNLIVECLQKVNSRDYPAHVIKDLVLRHTPDNLKELLKDRFVLVIKRRDEVVATGTLNGSEISTVFVKPDIHGRGLGRKMMQALEEHASTQGIEFVDIHASLTAVKFYEKLGYQHLDKVNRQVGGESFHMRKFLTL